MMVRLICRPILSRSLTFMLKHLAVDLRRIIVGFIDRKDSPGGSDAYFNTVSDPMYVFKNAIYAVQTNLGDGFLVSKA